jgi:hypothetical protein
MHSATAFTASEPLAHSAAISILRVLGKHFAQIAAREILVIDNYDPIRTTAYGFRH